MFQSDHQRGLQAALEAMARYDITFANCDEAWQRKGILRVIDAYIEAGGFDSAESLRTRAEAAEKRLDELEAALAESRQHVERGANWLRLFGQTDAAQDMERFLALSNKGGE